MGYARTSLSCSLHFAAGLIRARLGELDLDVLPVEVELFDGGVALEHVVAFVLPRRVLRALHHDGDVMRVGTSRGCRTCSARARPRARLARADQTSFGILRTCREDHLPLVLRAVPLLVVPAELARAGCEPWNRRRA